MSSEEEICLERFHRRERRWLLTEADAAELERFLQNMVPMAIPRAVGYPRYYGVESVYIRITKRARIRLRRYLAGDQEAAWWRHIKKAEDTSLTNSASFAEPVAILGDVPEGSIRWAGMADHPRSAGPFQRFYSGLLRRRHGASGRGRGDKGKAAKVDPRGSGNSESGVQQEQVGEK
jgi:hypothetical protein